MQYNDIGRDYLAELVNESLKKHIGKSCDLGKNIVNDIYDHITVKSDISKLYKGGLVEYRGMVGEIVAINEVYYKGSLCRIDCDAKFKSYCEIESQVKATPVKWCNFCCDLSEIKEVSE